MKRLSSPFTFYQKRVFPVIFGSFAGLILFFISWKAASFPVVFAVLIGLLIGALAARCARHDVRDYVDELIDEGNRLVVRNYGLEEAIALTDIREAKSSMMRPAGIWLHLRRDSVFGRSIKFLPHAALFGFSKLAKSLNERIRLAKDKAAEQVEI